MSPLIVTASPHIKSSTSTQTIMRDVVIALAPAAVAATVLFGLQALLMLLVSVAASVLAELAYEKAAHRTVTITDFPAVVTGLLLAMSLPVGMPLWQVVLGDVIAIVVVKQLFGGLGHNFANPAVTARIVLMLAFTSEATAWVTTNFADAVSSATPLALIGSGETAQLPSMLDMLVGNHMGCLGETCTIALLLGGAYLLVRRVITWHTPAAFLGTLFVITALLGQEPVYQVLSGGAILGAFFMATDYATTPSTGAGRIVFGIGCGIFTAIIRVYGNYPEGVSFSILLMNFATPYISRLTRHKPLGGIEA